LLALECVVDRIEEVGDFDMIVEALRGRPRKASSVVSRIRWPSIPDFPGKARSGGSKATEQSTRGC
jgi:hypothetical protein